MDIKSNSNFTAGKADWFPKRTTASVTALYYAVLGGLWVFYSDKLLFLLVSDPSIAQRIGSYKGWFYVGVTSILLWLVLERYFKKIRDSVLQLQESEARFVAIFENSPIAIGISRTSDQKIIHVNAAFVELFGYSREEAVGRTTKELGLWRNLERREGFVESLQSGSHVRDLETVTTLKSGEERDVIVSGGLVSLGGEPCFVAQIRDIAKRKRAETALRKAEEEYRAIFNNAPVGIFQSTPGGRYTRVNQAMAEIYGYVSPDEMIGNVQNISTQVYVDAMDRQRFRKIINEDGYVTGFEARNFRKDGTIFWSLTDARAVNGLDGKLLYYEGFLRDVTEQKTAEEDLKRRADEFHALYKTASEISGQSDLLELLNAVSARVAALLHVHSGGIYLYNNETNILEVVASTDNGIPIGAVLRFGEGMAGKVAQSKVPMFIDNYSQWEHRAEKYSSIPFTAVAEAPMLYNGELIGVLAAFDIEDNGRHIDDNDMRLLSLLANMVAGLVHNARNISERIQADERLRKSEEKYRTLFAGAPIAIYHIRMVFNGRIPVDFEYIDVNPEFWKAIGLNVSVIGKKVSEVIPGYCDNNTDSLEVFGRVALFGGITHWQHYFTELDKWYSCTIYSPAVGEVIIVADDITERKKTEIALKESEEKLRSLIEQSSEGIILTDELGRIVEWNLAEARLTGISTSDAMGMPVWEIQYRILPPERQSVTSPDHYKKIFFEILQSSNWEHLGQSFDVEIFTVHGERRYIRQTSFIVKTELGSRMGAVIHDITERRLAEDALMASEVRYRNLVENMIDIVVELDADGNFCYVSPNYQALTGYSVEEELGKSALRHVHPGDVQVLLTAMEQTQLSEQQSISYRVQRKDENWIWVEASNRPFLFADGNRHIIGVIRDITGRMGVEKSLREQLAELETLYETGLTLSHILSSRQVGQKLIELLEEKMDWHHTTIRLYDARDESLQVLAYSMDGDEDGTKERFNRIGKIGVGLTGWSVKHLQVVRSGDLGSDPRYVETFPGMKSGIYVPMRSRRQLIGVISIESDKPGAFSDSDERLVVTLANQAAVALDNANLFQTAQQEIMERKRMEQLLEEERNQLAHRVEERTSDLSHSNAELARAMKVRDEFLATMSHELRTPLTGILGLSEAIQLGVYGELSKQQNKVVATIESSGHHLLNLINDILDVSKIEAGKLDLLMEPCFLAIICASSIQLTKGMAGKKRQDVELVMEMDNIVVNGDGRRLKQVLVNLLSNAIKFTPELGEIKMVVSVDAQQKFVSVAISDTGIGISADDMKKLFEPFVQLDSSLAREYTGTGLGLMLVKSLVEKHNGTIRVESEPGKGSCFTVTLPVHKIVEVKSTGVKNTMPAETPIEQVSASTTVMILDDNKENIDLLHDYLVSKNFQVYFSLTGPDFLARVEDIAPDIILMDVQMPEMDGLEVMRRLRAHSNPRVSGIPLVAITALAMPGDKERCLQAGANHYLSRPLALRDLPGILMGLIK